MSKYEKCSFNLDDKKECTLLVNTNDITNIDSKILNSIKEEINTGKYSLCKDSCIYTNKNPWLENGENGTCKLPDNITYPDEFYDKNTGDIVKPDDVDCEYDEKTIICQERWYDWFTIPDYYHGNKTTYDKNTDICYDACPIGYIPYTKENKCIPKHEYEYGKYKGQIHYTPLQLVLLLGQTSNDILNRHIIEIQDYKTKIESSSIYEIGENLLDSNNIQDKYKTNINQDIDSDFQKRVGEIVDILKPENIVEPNAVVNKVSDYLNTKEHIEYAYDIASNINLYIKEPQKHSSNINDIKSAFLEQSTDVQKNNRWDILIKCCDLCFNGKTHYSNNILLYRLNEKRKQDDYKSELSFDLSSSEIPVVKENPNKDKKELNEADISMKKRIGDTIETDYTKTPFMMNTKQIITKLFLFIIFMFFVIIMIIILKIFWLPFVSTFNNAINSIMDLSFFTETNEFTVKKNQLQRYNNFLKNNYL